VIRTTSILPQILTSGSSPAIFQHTPDSLLFFGAFKSILGFYLCEILALLLAYSPSSTNQYFWHRILKLSSTVSHLDYSIPPNSQALLLVAGHTFLSTYQIFIRANNGTTHPIASFFLPRTPPIHPPEGLHLPPRPPLRHRYNNDKLHPFMALA
jgi:hypothetical protein